MLIKTFMTCFTFFYPTASATAQGQRPKFFRAEHLATAEGENCAYGPTLDSIINFLAKTYFIVQIYHAKSFKMKYIRSPYLNLLLRYSYRHLKVWLDLTWIKRYLEFWLRIMFAKAAGFIFISFQLQWDFLKMAKLEFSFVSYIFVFL